MSEAFNIFRERLKAELASGRINKLSLSKKASLSRSQLDRYLDGANEPNLSTAQRIANALGMTLSQMVGGEAPPAAPKEHTLGDCLRAVKNLSQLIDAGEIPKALLMLRDRDK